LRGYRLLVVLAVVCALGAALLSLRTIQAYVGQVEVIAAATNLSPDQMISSNDLQWVSFPKGALYGDTVLDPSHAEGYVLRGFVPAGTVLRQSMLEPGAVASIPGKLAQLSKDGTQYFAVALPENIFTTVGGQLQTGERVDVYLSTTPTPLASDVVVLSGIPVSTNQPASAQQGIVVAVDSQAEAAMLPYLTQGNSAKASLVLMLRPGRGA